MRHWPRYTVTMRTENGEIVYRIKTNRGALAAIESAMFQFARTEHRLSDVVAVTAEAVPEEVKS